MKSILSFTMLFLATPVLLAQDYINKEYNFTISLSSRKGWGEPQVNTASDGSFKKPVELVLVADNESGKRVSIQVLDVDDDMTISNPQHRAGFRSGIQKQFPPTLRIVAEEVSTFAGVPSYDLSLIGTIQGNPVNIRMIALTANSFQYNLTAISSDTTTLLDKDLNTVLATFKFNDPPKLPKPKKSSFEVGRIVGEITAYLVTAVIIAFFVLRVVKKRKAAA